MYCSDENLSFAQNSQSVDDSVNDDSSIAVIGMAGRFPGADNVGAFWENLKAGVESIHFFTDDELRGSPYVTDDELADPAYVKARGTFNNIDLFDAEFFGISPREAGIMDPQLRVFLECAFNALEDAGYDPFTHVDPIGVFAGASTSTYLLHMLQNMPRGISNELQLLLYNSGNCLATYTSYKLGLKGPSVNVQTACSTSLVATHYACQSLLSGECDTALAGGVSIDVRQRSGYLYEPSGIASPDGHCRAFDAEAAGCVAGSGVGIVVLKRLSDALADGDNVHAVIKASAVNNDGANKVGFTAPSIQGQADVIATAIELANIDPETLGYIECHGTGTGLGDPMEVAALSQALQTYTDKRGFCAIGSVKTNIGHLDAAAGVASLIKAILAVKHGQLPPSINYNKPNPKFDLQNSPLFVNTQLRDWPEDLGTRLAGVSSFGIGGSNAHVIIEQAPLLISESKPEQVYTIPLSARTPAALQNLCSNVADFLKQNPKQNLADVSYTLQVGRAAWEYRHCITAKTVEEACRLLDSPKPSQQCVANPSIVFMFPGQGTQYSEMAAGLYLGNPEFRRHADLCITHLLNCADPQTIEAVRGSFNGERRSLDNTSVAQVALFIVEYAFAKTLMEYGVTPTAMIGHSLGEYVAACISGVIALEQCLPLVVKRGQLIEALPAGAMLAVWLTEDQVRELLPQELAVATVNTQSLCVVSGPMSAVTKLELELKDKGIECKRLTVSHAFHSPMMDPAIDPFRQHLAKVQWQQPQIPFVSNVTGKWISKEDLAQPDGYWIRHMCETVRFADGLAAILQQPGILVEVGPGTTLGGLAKKHPSFGAAHILVRGMRREDEVSEDLRMLHDCLGSLWSSGTGIDWDRFQNGTTSHRISIPTYPFERKRYWIGGGDDRTVAKQDPLLPQQLRQDDVSKWFYTPCWKQLVPVRSGNSTYPANMLFVIGDQEGLEPSAPNGNSSTLIQMWCGGTENTTLQSFSIDIEDAAQCDRLFQKLAGQEGAPVDLVYIPQTTGETTETDAHRIKRDCMAILNLVISVNKHSNNSPVRICILTQSAFSVTGNEPSIDTAAAALLGLCRVISQEYPNSKTQMLDIDSPAWSNRDGIIRNEMAMDAEGGVVAYRNGRRWAMTYEQLIVNNDLSNDLSKDLSNEVTSQALVKPGGTYLITGGLGNIGLIFAEYLTRQKCANLVLVGTSNFPARDLWNEYDSANDVSANNVSASNADPAVKTKIQTLRHLESLGVNIEIVRANVADEVQMRAVIENIINDYGALNGIIHCAGYVKPDSLQPLHQTDDNLFQLHLLPKVTGTNAIDAAISDLNPDFCVLVSSISTLLGGIGYGAYSVANCYLDAFAAMKNSATSSTAWISVDFDGWVFSEAAQIHSDRYQQLAELAITPQEGRQAIKSLFALGIEGQVIVSTADLQRRIRELRITNTAAQRMDNQKSDAYHERPSLAVPYIAPRNDLETAVVEIMEQALHITGVGVEDNFFELGGDSLMGIQILSHVKKKFEVEIPVKSMFEHPTPSQLALLIEQMMLDEISRLSDEEAEALVNEMAIHG